MPASTCSLPGVLDSARRTPGIGEPLHRLRPARTPLGGYRVPPTGPVAIYQETHNRQGEGLVLMNLGSAYLALRHSGEAIDCYQQALVIYEAGGDRHFEGEGRWTTWAAPICLSDGVKRQSSVTRRPWQSTGKQATGPLKLAPLTCLASRTRTCDNCTMPPIASSRH